MKTVKVVLAMLVILFSFTNLSAQSALDTIYKKSGKVMVVKVTEVLPDVVKYIYHNGADSIIMGVDREELQKIAFANGAVQTFITEMMNPEHYADQHKNALKVDFFAPAFNHLTIDYEHSIKPGLSWESGVSLVGVGYAEPGAHDASGAIFGGGIKLIQSPDFYSSRQHYAHILKGGYIRLQGYLGYYTENYTTTYYPPYTSPYTSPTAVKVTDKYSMGGLHIQFGKQFVFDDIFLIDFFVGLGYAVVNFSSNNPNYQNNYLYNYSSNENNSELTNYVYDRISSTSPLSISGGLRIGILF